MTGPGKRTKKVRRRTRPGPHFVCPCCDYVTLSERGKYLICPICFWEDEKIHCDTNPREPSAANHSLTLAEGRDSFKTIGACEAAMLPHVLPEENRAAYLYFPLKD